MMADAITGITTQQTSVASVTQKVQTQLAEARAVVKQQETAQQQSEGENNTLQQAQQVQPNVQVQAMQQEPVSQPAPSAQSIRPTSAAEVSLTDNARIYTIEQKVNRGQELTTDEMNYIRANDSDLYQKALREEELLAAEEARTAAQAAPQIG